MPAGPGLHLFGWPGHEAAGAPEDGPVVPEALVLLCDGGLLGVQSGQRSHELVSAGEQVRLPLDAVGLAAQAVRQAVGFLDGLLVDAGLPGRHLFSGEPGAAQQGPLPVPPLARGAQLVLGGHDAGAADLVQVPFDVGLLSPRDLLLVLQAAPALREGGEALPEALQGLGRRDGQGLQLVEGAAPQSETGELDAQLVLLAAQGLARFGQRLVQVSRFAGGFGAPAQGRGIARLGPGGEGLLGGGEPALGLLQIAAHLLAAGIQLLAALAQLLDAPPPLQSGAQRLGFLQRQAGADVFEQLSGAGTQLVPLGQQTIAALLILLVLADSLVERLDRLRPVEHVARDVQARHLVAQPGELGGGTVPSLAGRTESVLRLAPPLREAGGKDDDLAQRFAAGQPSAPAGQARQGTAQTGEPVALGLEPREATLQPGRLLALLLQLLPPPVPLAAGEGKVCQLALRLLVLGNGLIDLFDLAARPEQGVGLLVERLQDLAQVARA